MPYPHPIRLRGPWQWQPTSDHADDAAAATNLGLDDDWRARLGDTFQGRARLTRRFNRPAQLDPHERLWLVLDQASTVGEVWLNDHRIGSVTNGAAAFDITASLRPSNQLRLDVELSPATPCPVAEVRLEVRAAQYLDGVRLERRSPDGGVLHVRVAGEPTDAPLALLAAADGRELAYHPCQLGDTIALPLELPDGSPLDIRLIAGATTCWQTRLVQFDKPDCTSA